MSWKAFKSVEMEGSLSFLRSYNVCAEFMEFAAALTQLHLYLILQAFCQQSFIQEFRVIQRLWCEGHSEHSYKHYCNSLALIHHMPFYKLHMM